MNRKKIFSICLLMNAILCSYAQVNWHISAGLNYTNISATIQDAGKANSEALPGIYLSLGAELPLSEHFSVQPALAYAKRGFKQAGSATIGWGKDFEAKVNYLELPVDFIYSLGLGSGKLQFAAGPYLGYGTGGKWQTNGSVLVGDIVFEGPGDISFQNDATISGKGLNSLTYAKPWDYGLRFRIGYAFLGRYALSLLTQHGLANLQPRWADFKPQNTIRNRSVGAMLSYGF